MFLSPLEAEMLTVTAHETEDYEKDLGEDDYGCPMIVIRTYHTMTMKADRDIRGDLTPLGINWSGCDLRAVDGSDLQATLAEHYKQDWLYGITEVSEDGRTFTLVWR
jgi:hypothetical protein